MTGTIISGAAAILLYLVSAYLLGTRLMSGGPGLPAWRSLAPGAAAVVLHSVVLSQTLFVAGGLNLGFFTATSLVTWLVALLVLLAAAARPVANLGIALLPLAALGLATQLLFPAPAAVLTEAPVPLQLHVLISILAYSLFAIAAVQALLLAVQDRHLHQHHPGGFVRALPPLAVMESLLFQLIGLGFALLTLGLFSGALFLENLFAQHLVHKTFFSLVAWVVFATLLWGRWRFGWRGRKAIRWTLAGFAALALAFTGTELVRQLILHR
jgi:ABC-type uncharacterized transport system permease subunit